MVLNQLNTSGTKNESNPKMEWNFTNSNFSIIHGQRACMRSYDDEYMSHEEKKFNIKICYRIVTGEH